MTTVLVTGGAGYIGSHACKALAGAGFTPVAYDNLTTGHASAVQWGPLVEGDLLDAARLADTIDRYNPAAVMHFAAKAYVGESVQQPLTYYRNNVTGSLTLLEAMRDHRIPHMVFSSTCAVYGIPETVPITEDSGFEPVNPYGATKVTVERMLADFARAGGPDFMALRYFNACGADADGDIGEDHNPETHLIPRALMAATGDIPALEVFGTDYETADGTCVRDFIHVTDLADAHVIALQHLINGAASAAFNLGTGHGFSVSEVIQSAKRVTGVDFPVDVGPRRPGDPPVLVADPSRAHDRLGFQAVYTDLDDIVRSAWTWHRSNSRRRAGGN